MAPSSAPRRTSTPRGRGRTRPPEAGAPPARRRPGRDQPAERAALPRGPTCSARAGSARSTWPGGWAPSSVVPAVVCIKVSERIDGWVREAYFGQLLDGHPRAIRVFDTFPLLGNGRRVLYCLVLEYASHGDLRAFLRRTGKRWPETVARREIAGILQVLGKLHRGPAPAPRPHAVERVRVRGPLPEAGRLRHRAPAERPARDGRRHPEPAHGAQRHHRGRRPQVAGPRRRVPGGPAAGDAGEGRRRRAHPHRRDPPAAVQRPPEGDRLPLHRRAPEEVRERRRAHRGPPPPAGSPEGRACGRRSRAPTWPSRAS